MRCVRKRQVSIIRRYRNLITTTTTITTTSLSMATDVDKSSRCVSAEVLPTMTSQQQGCPDVRWRRRSSTQADTETATGSPSSTCVTANPPRPPPPRYAVEDHQRSRDDDRSTGTGSSCSECHVTVPAGDDDVGRACGGQTVGGVVGLTTVHRRRRRTAFTSDQVNVLGCE